MLKYLIAIAVVLLFQHEVFAGGPAYPCPVTVGDIQFTISMPPEPTSKKGSWCDRGVLATLFPPGSVVQIISASRPEIEGVFLANDITTCSGDIDGAGKIIRLRCRDVEGQSHEMTQEDWLAVSSRHAATVRLP